MATPFERFGAASAAVCEFGTIRERGGEERCAGEMPHEGQR